MYIICLPYALYAAEVSSVSWQSWKSLMTSAHNRCSCPACKKTQPGAKFATPGPSPTASSASESPAVQRDPAAQRTHSLSQGMLWAETQPSGTSLSEQRLPHVFLQMRLANLYHAAILFRHMVGKLLCSPPAQAMDLCEVQGCFTL